MFRKGYFVMRTDTDLYVVKPVESDGVAVKEANTFHIPYTHVIPEHGLSPQPFLANQDFGSNYFRIPAGEKLDDGTIVALSQVQYAGASDYTNQDIGYAKSIDGSGWADKKIIAQAINTDSRLLNPTTIYDSANNRVILMVTEVFNTDHVVWWETTDDMWDTYILVSNDGGDTWTKNSIKDSLIATRQTNWSVSMPGLGTGVVTNDGKYVFAMETGYNNGTTSRIQNTLAVSTDLVNWTLSEPTPERGDEANVVMLDNSTIMLNARNYGAATPKFRKVFTTTDLGQTWQAHTTHQTIPENRATMGHTLKVTIEGVDCFVLSHMQSENSTRKELGLSVLNANQTQWTPIAIIEPEPYDGYSLMVWNENDPDTLGLLYEKGGNILHVDISHLLPEILSSSSV